MKIGELAQRSGLSIDTLRYYERLGLLPKPLRDRARQRVYDHSILTWLEFLLRLKTTGMPLKDMRLYAQWREQGATTLPMRQRLLEDHRDKLRARLEQLRDNLAQLDAKISFYQTELDKDHDAS